MNTNDKKDSNGYKHSMNGCGCGSSGADKKNKPSASENHLNNNEFNKSSSEDKSRADGHFEGSQHHKTSSFIGGSRFNGSNNADGRFK